MAFNRNSRGNPSSDAVTVMHGNVHGARKGSLARDFSYMEHLLSKEEKRFLIRKYKQADRVKDFWGFVSHFKFIAIILLILVFVHFLFRLFGSCLVLRLRFDQNQNCAGENFLQDTLYTLGIMLLVPIVAIVMKLVIMLWTYIMMKFRNKRL